MRTTSLDTGFTSILEKKHGVQDLRIEPSLEMNRMLRAETGSPVQVFPCYDVCWEKRGVRYYLIIEPELRKKRVGSWPVKWTKYEEDKEAMLAVLEKALAGTPPSVTIDSRSINRSPPASIFITRTRLVD